MSSITFSTPATTHVPSSCAALPMTSRAYWVSQLPTAGNGTVAAAAKNRKDGPGARAFEDPL